MKGLKALGALLIVAAMVTCVGAGAGDGPPERVFPLVAFLGGSGFLMFVAGRFGD